MLAHVPLKVEVGELIGRLECKELLELGIWVNLAAVGRVLELVGTDVGINLAGDIGAGNESTLVLGKELSKLVADKGRLDESTWGTGGIALLALVACLLDCLDLALSTLLEELDASNHVGKLMAHSGKGSNALHVSGIDIKLGCLTHNRGHRRRICYRSNRGNGLGSRNFNWLGSLLGHTHNRDVSLS